MARKVLRAARCSQMSNPDAGTGSGGDRCVESVTAMLDATFAIGPRVANFWSMTAADQEAAVLAAMRSIVELWNGPGAVVSALEPGGKIADWVAQNSGAKITIPASEPLTWAAAKSIIDRQRVAVIGENDYSQSRLANGGDPYQWGETEHAGHVILLVGYDDDFIDAKLQHWGQALVVHDPLRAYSGQPCSYSYQSLKNTVAQVSEVQGPALPYLVNTAPAPAPVQPPTPPAPAPPTLAEWLAYRDAVEKWLLAAPKPPA